MLLSLRRVKTYHGITLNFNIETLEAMLFSEWILQFNGKLIIRFDYEMHQFSPWKFINNMNFCEKKRYLIWYERERANNFFVSFFSFFPLALVHHNHNFNELLLIEMDFPLHPRKWYNNNWWRQTAMHSKIKLFHQKLLVCYRLCQYKFNFTLQTVRFIVCIFASQNNEKHIRYILECWRTQQFAF